MRRLVATLLVISALCAHGAVSEAHARGKKRPAPQLKPAWQPVDPPLWQDWDAPAVEAPVVPAGLVLRVEQLAAVVIHNREFTLVRRRWRSEFVLGDQRRARATWVSGLRMDNGPLFAHAALGVERRVSEELAIIDPASQTAWTGASSVGTGVALVKRPELDVSLEFELASTLDEPVSHWLITLTVDSL